MSSIRERAIKNGYRSGLEETVAKQLEQAGVKVEYETTKIKYRVEEDHTYTPDFVLPNGIVIETKGRFVLEDRKKHLLIQKQHPELDIRFVFSNARVKLYKGSKTMYSDWCDKYGFKWHNKVIPVDWINE